MAKTDFFEDIIDFALDFKHKKSKTPWYQGIISSLSKIHKKNPLNEIQYKLETNNNKEYLIYMVIYDEKYIDIKVYIPELKDCFLVKLNCKINKTLLSIYEIVLEDIDKVSKYLDANIFKIVLSELETYCTKNKIFAINILTPNFIPPLNKEMEHISINSGYRQIKTNLGISMYKDIKPQAKPTTDNK